MYIIKVNKGCIITTLNYYNLGSDFDMAKFIGTGQCGNKNMINLIEKSIVSADDVLLLNTTLKDIPDRFRERAVIFGDGIGGSGKERKYA